MQLVTPLFFLQTPVHVLQLLGCSKWGVTTGNILRCPDIQFWEVDLNFLSLGQLNLVQFDLCKDAKKHHGSHAAEQQEFVHKQKTTDTNPLSEHHHHSCHENPGTDDDIIYHPSANMHPLFELMNTGQSCHSSLQIWLGCKIGSLVGHTFGGDAMRPLSLKLFSLSFCLESQNAE